MTKQKRSVIIITSVLSVVLIFSVVFYLLYLNSDGKNQTEKGAVTNTEVYTEPLTEPPTEEKDAVDSMTLEQKVAQMIMVSCHQGVDIEAASEYGVGGLCLYGYSFEDKTFDEVVEMVSSYQSLSKTPMLVSVDEEGGTVVRVSDNPNLRETPFLSPSELYNQGGMELVKSDTEEKADLLLSLGINVNLAPVCDVPLDSTNYIYDRCVSLDHYVTSTYVSTVVSAMKDKNIGSCLKHFPGYGGSVDTHQSMSYDNREYADFVNGDFMPFESGIDAGADCVLVSHNIVSCMDDTMPASLSKPIHDILRNDLGFSGVIMTDDLVMEGIAQFTNGENAAVMAVMAGNDMIICEDYEEAVKAIVKAVNNGEISENQITESARRVMKWKVDLGLIK